MQERNTNEHEDRIQVYPSVPLRWDERRCEGDYDMFNANNVWYSIIL